jgi:hypothetical protein
VRIDDALLTPDRDRLWVPVVLTLPKTSTLLAEFPARALKRLRDIESSVNMVDRERTLEGVPGRDDDVLRNLNSPN